MIQVFMIMYCALYINLQIFMQVFILDFNKMDFTDTIHMYHSIPIHHLRIHVTITNKLRSVTIHGVEFGM